jgi:hypothetical protein
MSFKDERIRKHIDLKGKLEILRSINQQGLLHVMQLMDRIYLAYDGVFINELAEEVSAIPIDSLLSFNYAVDKAWESCKTQTDTYFVNDLQLLVNRNEALNYDAWGLISQLKLEVCFKDPELFDWLFDEKTFVTLRAVFGFLLKFAVVKKKVFAAERVHDRRMHLEVKSFVIVLGNYIELTISHCFFKHKTAMQEILSNLKAEKLINFKNCIKFELDLMLNRLSKLMFLPANQAPVSDLLNSMMFILFQLSEGHENVTANYARFKELLILFQRVVHEVLFSETDAAEYYHLLSMFQ